jgi:hypothetical protein
MEDRRREYKGSLPYQQDILRRTASQIPRYHHDDRLDGRDRTEVVESEPLHRAGLELFSRSEVVASAIASEVDKNAETELWKIKHG